VASGGSSAAFGANSTSSGFASSAFGASAQATGASSTAIGGGAIANNTSAVAIGTNALGSGQNGTAIGTGSDATMLNSTAVGANAQAIHSGSTAVGASAATTRTNQVRLGTTGTSVSIADISASDAAQTGLESLVTVDANGTLGTRPNTSQAIIERATADISGLQSGQEVLNDQIAGLRTGQASLFDLARINRREARRGIAAAAAISNAPFPPEPGQTGYAANTAVYRGQAAVSVSFTHRLRGAKSFAVTGGVAHSGGKDTVVKAGVAGVF
jgi:autotransporter adhesin